MFKPILILLLSVVSSRVVAQNMSPSYWKPWKPVQTYAADLDWKLEKLPKAVYDALPEDMRLDGKDGEPETRPGAFASIDLDGDGKDELIVHSAEFYSGGPEYAVMQQRGNRWRVIGEIQGGFTVAKQKSQGYAYIETWSRHPNTYHRLWRFIAGRYVIVKKEIASDQDSWFDIPYVAGARSAPRSPATKEFQKIQPCPSTSKISDRCPSYSIAFITPLERGGTNSPSNMQWRENRPAQIKD